MVAREWEGGPPISFVLNTNRGGVAVTVCACGVLLLPSLAHHHIVACPTVPPEIKENYGDQEGA